MNNFSLDQYARQAAQRGNDLHAQFLDLRQQGLAEMRDLVAAQMSGTPTAGAGMPAPALFDAHQLEAFALGSFSACFGARLAAYDGRPIPRIPNGDLRMMTRVLQIHGQPFSAGRERGAVGDEIRVAYDVPREAWYFGQAAGQIPYALWMEIALQPCGFLSAYLDTYSLLAYPAFFFRNLDGNATLAAEMPDLRGQTLVTHARMLSSVAGAGTVIQRFAFQVSAAGQTLYQGESAFGYFSPEAMAAQAGLDGGRPSAPEQRGGQSGGQFALPGSGRMHFFNEITVQAGGGRFGRGLITARRAITPQDWYFPFHFHGDPVMPGSLGIEAMLQAYQGGCAVLGQSGVSTGASFQWRYRGQITPAHREMEVELHCKPTGGADGSLWVDGLRIYEVTNLGG